MNRTIIIKHSSTLWPKPSAAEESSRSIGVESEG